MPNGGKTMKHFIAAALCCAAAAYAGDGYTKIDASQIVTGTAQVPVWPPAVNIPGMPATIDNKYSTVSTVWQDQIQVIWLGGWNVYRPEYYAGTGWSPQAGPAVVQPAPIESAVATVPKLATNPQETYSNPYVVRSAVDFGPGNGVNARVSNGKAYTDFNYRVSTTNNNGSTRDYFLTFPTPNSKRTVGLP